LVGVAPSVAIAADDLTGACDSAAAFARRGWRTTVSLRAPEVPRAGEAAAVDTRSRQRPLETDAPFAALAVADVALLKVDSLLRGRYAEDLGRLLGSRPALFCPALPELGRAFSGEGVLEQLRPVRVRAGEPLPDAPLVVADAATADDLDRLVAAASPGTLWVGSSGLAHALARAHGGEVAAPSFAVEGEIVVAVGSRSAQARRQLARLEGVAIGAAPDGDGPEDVVHAERLAAGLAPAAAEAGAVVATGGDTARALLEALGVERLEVLGELEPGVVTSRTPAGAIFVTKAGSFGDDDTLARVVARLRA
jgi:uncharacterized protein YgbK (DUF1537 family)